MVSSEALPRRLVIRRSLQLGVFRLGLLEDRDVLVGVFPKREEVLVGFPRFRRVARDLGGARQPQVGNRIVQSPIRIEPGPTPTGALVIQDLLELGYGLHRSEERRVGKECRSRW